jgi:hypothetical protein
MILPPDHNWCLPCNTANQAKLNLEEPPRPPGKKRVRKILILFPLIYGGLLTAGTGLILMLFFHIR